MANAPVVNFLTQAQRCTTPPDPAIDSLLQGMQNTIQSLLSRPVTAQDHPVLNDIAAACYHMIGPIAPRQSRGLSEWVRGDFYAILAEALACLTGNMASEEAQHSYTMARVSYEMARFQRAIKPGTPTDVEDRLQRLNERWLPAVPSQNANAPVSNGGSPGAAEEDDQFDDGEIADQDQDQDMELSEPAGDGIDTDNAEAAYPDRDDNTEVPERRESYYSLVYDCFISGSAADRTMQIRDIRAWVKVNATKRKYLDETDHIVERRISVVLSEKEEYERVYDSETGKAKKGLWKLRDNADPVSARKKG